MYCMFARPQEIIPQYIIGLYMYDVSLGSHCEDSDFTTPTLCITIAEAKLTVWEMLKYEVPRLLILCPVDI